MPRSFYDPFHERHTPLMPPMVERDAPRLINGRPEGMLEYELADIIHAMTLSSGFDATRQACAEALMAEADRRPRQ